jgi:hypothetical protein
MKLNIRLGPQRFAAEREGLSIMGTVQRGLQIGALAVNPDGEYLQVNGDVTQPLNKSRVELALKKSGGLPKPPKPSAGPTVAPTVIVKPRRRIAVMPPTGAAVAPVARTETPVVTPAPAAPAEPKRVVILSRRKLPAAESN